jgi:hypothetical protein
VSAESRNHRCYAALVAVKCLQWHLLTHERNCCHGWQYPSVLSCVADMVCVVNRLSRSWDQSHKLSICCLCIVQVRDESKGESSGSISPDTVAEDFWQLYQNRDSAVWFVKRS